MVAYGSAGMLSIQWKFVFLIKMFSNNQRILQNVALQVKNHFKNIGVPADVKYIDPTYMIRACRANASDRILCAVLGQNAVRVFFKLS